MFRNRTSDFNKFKGDRPPITTKTSVTTKVSKFTTSYEQIKNNLIFLQSAINSLYILHSHLMLVIIDSYYEDSLQNAMLDNIKEIKTMIAHINIQLDGLEKDHVSITLKRNILFILRTKFKNLKYAFHHTCTDYTHKLEFWNEQTNIIRMELFD